MISTDNGQTMVRKPKPLPRTDLSYMKPVDALAVAMASFNNTTSILFCARRADQTARFGAVVKRDDVPSYLRFAIAVEEAGHDIQKQLSVLLKGGVADQDVNLVTGLMAAVAQQEWRARNLTVDQVRCASIILSAAETEVSLIGWERN
jgi:hypothetical protein